MCKPAPSRSAFADLLKKCCTPYDWHLVEEYAFKGTAKQPLRAYDLIDRVTLRHGLCETKDASHDRSARI